MKAFEKASINLRKISQVSLIWPFVGKRDPLYCGDENFLIRDYKLLIRSREYLSTSDVSGLW